MLLFWNQEIQKLRLRVCCRFADCQGAQQYWDKNAGNSNFKTKVIFNAKLVKLKLRHSAANLQRKGKSSSVPFLKRPRGVSQLTSEFHFLPSNNNSLGFIIAARAFYLQYWICIPFTKPLTGLNSAIKGGNVYVACYAIKAQWYKLFKKFINSLDFASF